MEDNPNQPPNPPPIRRFVYRSAQPDTNLTHPLRRATDTPRPFQQFPGQPSDRTQMLKFRVYLKIN